MQQLYNMSAQFQPTPSARRVTYIVCDYWADSTTISTHTLRKEGDWLVCATVL